MSSNGEKRWWREDDFCDERSECVCLKPRRSESCIQDTRNALPGLNLTRVWEKTGMWLIVVCYETHRATCSASFLSTYVCRAWTFVLEESYHLIYRRRREVKFWVLCREDPRRGTPSDRAPSVPRGKWSELWTLALWHSENFALARYVGTSFSQWYFL